MKVNKILLGLFLALALTSCKDEKKSDETSTPEKKEEVKSNFFTVTLNATVKKDDSFQLYYKDKYEAPYEEQNSMFIEFKGSESPQDIVFKLPEEALPNYIRLDFGTNKNQEPVTVNSVKINYLGKNFDIKGSDFFKYFVVNELTMKADKEKSIVTPITTKEGTYDPITYSEKALFDQIQLLQQ